MIITIDEAVDLDAATLADLEDAFVKACTAKPPQLPQPRPPADITLSLPVTPSPLELTFVSPWTYTTPAVPSIAAYETYQLPEDRKAEWIAALRSGEYTQIRGSIGRGKHRCAIGVAYDLAGDEKIHEWFGVAADSPQSVALTFTLNQVARLNDHGGLTFPQIADWIETNL